MKKISYAFFATILLSTAPFKLNAKPESAQTSYVVYFKKSDGKKSDVKTEQYTITVAEIKGLIDKLLVKIGPNAKKLPPEKIALLKEKIAEYLIKEGATYLLALRSGTDKSPKVKTAIENETKKIIIAQFLSDQTDLARSAQTDKDYIQAQKSVMAEKGDQVSLTVMTIQGNSTDDKRIIAKINGIKEIGKKATEIKKMSSQYEGKEVGPILISDLVNSDMGKLLNDPKKAELFKDQMSNCKTGDIVRLEITSDDAKKESQTILFFVTKREPFSGELLSNAILSKIMEDVNKSVDQKIMQQVIVEKIQKDGEKITIEQVSPAASA